MKVARIRHDGRDGWALVDADAATVRRSDATIAQWGPRALTDGEEALGTLGPTLDLSAVQLLAPLEAQAMITGTGKNYESWVNQRAAKGLDRHADLPFYFRSPRDVIGSGGTLRYPEITAHQPQCVYVYELEMIAFVAHTIDSQPGGIADVLGYAVGNDGCLRGQRPSFLGMDVIGSKSGHQSSAIGPWIVTADEFGGVQPDLHMEARLNGVLTQEDRTSNMTWNIDLLVEEASLRTRLTAGDAIYTGTCGYVGVQDGYIEPGDLLEMEIERLGVLSMTMEALDPYADIAAPYRHLRGVDASTSWRLIDA